MRYFPRPNRFAVLLTTAALCTGQACVPPGPSPADLDSPIPEGIYTGTVVGSSKLMAGTTLVNEQQESIESALTFGPDGLPLTDANEPIFIGYTDILALGGAEFRLTVAGIQSVADGISIDYDVEMLFDAEGVQIVIAGGGAETYRLRADGSLDYFSTLSVGGVASGRFLVSTMSLSGTLSR